MLIYSDASIEGWEGADDIVTGGCRWSENEMPGHINVSELHAAKLCLPALVNTKSNIHVRLLLDNTTAICYINNMGGSHSMLQNKFGFGELTGQLDIFLGKKTVLLTLSQRISKTINNGL